MRPIQGPRKKADKKLQQAGRLCRIPLRIPHRQCFGSIHDRDEQAGGGLRGVAAEKSKTSVNASFGG